ncbi:MAG: hypothetical protein EHM71_04030 [Zetaproteobacteria bacterium]|nr:MAG: hypothetical protein EHM71_04030 [Zetaproteobacteria bacterium]
MRKQMAIVVILALFLAALPTAAMAGDPHAVRNRWAGVGIGVAVATVGGLLLSGFYSPAVVAPPPAPYAPPVVYAPLVVYTARPPMRYSPRPVVVYQGWGPPGHWKHHQRHFRR